MAFVVLNGYPGVGKLTIARSLGRALPNTRVFHNHLFIDAVVALYDRDDAGFLPLRRALRSAAFEALHDSVGRDRAAGSAPPLVIFTEMQTASDGDDLVMLEYAAAARAAGVPLISFVLTCALEENVRRLDARAAQLGASATSKLRDAGILRECRDGTELFRYGALAAEETEIDVTALDVGQAVEAMSRVIQSTLTCAATTTPGPVETVQADKGDADV